MIGYSMRPVRLLALLLLSGASHTAQSSSATTSPLMRTSAVITVEIRDFQFVPATITVAPGQVVVWINRDDEPHTVVAVDKSFRSLTLDTDERFTRTFSGSGEFSYYCSFHPHMIGKVTVVQRAQG